MTKAPQGKVVPDEASLELWGGLECTVARVGDDYRDQSRETGHHERLDDLDRIAALGIRTLRYPVLWETIAPRAPDEADFTWHDERLARLGALGIRPIAGLCHHGSGPAYTDMLDPAWPDLLARHARAVAERYPHLDLYTPVNEPLTTARFSALYGHWYPHGTDHALFLRALVNQCKAVVLAMRAVRAVNPAAGLVQTDDFGKTFATPSLAYQADYENDRRWLTFDLLCGRVDRDHPFWGWFTHSGVPQADLELFLEGDAAPDIIGINHYLTSERYLDQRYRRYPEHHWGSNGRQLYADAEAVRIPALAEAVGPLPRLAEVWERYRRPMAVTEAHHGCTRDEQLRWLVEVWEAARTLRREGADIRAVTVWSLFGTVDWSSLLTRRNGHYEPGPFDVRGPAPRRTALATASEALAREGAFAHPVLDRPGWWRRTERFYHPPKTAPAMRVAGAPRPILVTGATGTLGRALSRICDHRGLDHVLTDRRALDIADPDSVAAALRRHRPWAVVNAAGFVRVAQAEREPEACRRANALGPGILAEACAAAGLPLLTFSSDLVFDGRLGRAYGESDPVSPASAYGRAKAEGEALALAANERTLVVRTSAFFGPWDRHNFVWGVLNGLAAGRRVSAGADVVSPTYVPDLVHAVLDLLIDGAAGLWHVASPGAVAWADLARDIARRAELDPALVTESAANGANTALTSERGVLLPPLESALNRYLDDCEIPWRPAARSMIAAE